MPVIRWHLGQNCHKDTTPRNSVPLHFHGVLTGAWITPTDEDTGEYEWGDCCTRLPDHEERTEKILWLVEHIIKNHRGDILVAVNRKAFAYQLTTQLVARGVSAVSLTGDLTGKDRVQTYEDIIASEYRVTVGMLQIISDGASNPNWHHAINTVPFSDPKTVEQLKGRPIRKMKGKTAAHYWDIIDEPIGMLNRMSKVRFREIKEHIVSAIWHEILPSSTHTYTLTERSK